MDPQLSEVGQKQFSSHRVTIGSFYDDVKRGTEYDLSPDHQRNVVHNDKWRAEVIKSLLKGMPIGQPEFDTEVKENGLTIRRSIDGKQRCVALTKFLDSEYKYTCDWPSAMTGKKFNEISDVWKQKLRQQPFEVCVTGAHLSDDEISAHFIKKQDTKKTSFGEELNASQHLPVVSFAKDICRVNSTLMNELPIGGERHKPLELIVRMVYACGVFSAQGNGNPDPNNKKIRTWLSHQSEEAWREHIINTLNIVNMCESNSKCSKTWVLPLLALVFKNNLAIDWPIRSIQEIQGFVTSEVDTENFYDLVGGSHSTTLIRIEKITNEWYDNWIGHTN